MTADSTPSGHDPGSDDGGEFDDHDPTVDDAVRLWHYGVARHGDETVLGIREFASLLCEESAEQRAVWIESVRRVKEIGLVDAETALNLVHHIIQQHFDNIVNLEDPRQQRISEAMGELCDRHGLPGGTDFTRHANPPAEWVALVKAGDELDEIQWMEILLENGEAAHWQMRADRRHEYDALIARVDQQLAQ